MFCRVLRFLCCVKFHRFGHRCDSFRRHDVSPSVTVFTAAWSSLRRPPRPRLCCPRLRPHVDGPPLMSRVSSGLPFWPLAPPPLQSNWLRLQGGHFVTSSICSVWRCLNFAGSLRRPLFYFLAGVPPTRGHS